MLARLVRTIQSTGGIGWLRSSTATGGISNHINRLNENSNVVTGDVGTRFAENLPFGQMRKPFSSKGLEAEVDAINELFAEAREEIMDAKDESETVYFDESVAAATASVDTVLSRWSALLSKQNEDEKLKLQRSMGLKIEQLKAELDQLQKMHST